MIYSFSVTVVRILLIFFSKIEVIGKHNIPKEGGVIIACPHTGWADVIYIAVASMPRKVSYMAKKEIFNNKFVAWFLTQLHVFTVDRDKPGASTMKQASDILIRGEAMVIFPSGTRTEGVTLKRGAISLSQNSKVPMVPAFYVGPKTINFKHFFSRPNVKIIYGEPIKFPVIEEMDLSPKELKEYQINKIKELSLIYSELEKKISKVTI